MTTPDEECRKAFEEVYVREFGSSSDLLPKTADSYQHVSANFAWCSWKDGWHARVPAGHCVVKEEILKDAKRYQWIRTDPPSGPRYVDLAARLVKENADEFLDAEIDKAMLAASQGEK